MSPSSSLESECSLLVLLNEARQFAEGVAKSAGNLCRDAFYQSAKIVESKSCAQDLVTQTDKKVEELIRKLLLEKYPNHRFIGEESHFVLVKGEEGEGEGEGEQGKGDAEERDTKEIRDIKERDIKEGKRGIPNEPTWIVDPIDGTTNFVHGLPLFCISIGLCINQQPVVGVVYNPITDELFSAAQGQGATLNGKQISVSKVASTLSNSLLVNEFIPDNQVATTITIQSSLKLMQTVHGIRTLGTAALDLCYTACGRVDGFYQSGLKCWDICAGVIIVREAGGHVIDYFENQPFDLGKGALIATNCKAIADEILIILNSKE